MKPICTLFALDGSFIIDSQSSAFISATVSDYAGGEADTLEFVIDDRDQPIGWPAEGTHVFVVLGYAAYSYDGLGEFVIDEVAFEDPPATLTVRARAADMTGLMKQQKTREWKDMTLAAIVGKIAGEHRLSHRVGPSLAGIRPSHLSQTEESDLHFLTRLAEDYDAVFKVASGELLFWPEGDSWHLADLEGDLIVTRLMSSRVAITRGGRDKYQSVAARWHDKAAKKTYYELAGEGEPKYTLRHTYPSAAAAKAAAQAKLKALNSGSDSVSVTRPGDHRLAAGRIVQLDGFRPHVDGYWVIDSATHTIGSGGYTTTVECVAKVT
jgi:phage protein D